MLQVDVSQVGVIYWLVSKTVVYIIACHTCRNKTMSSRDNKGKLIMTNDNFTNRFISVTNQLSCNST